MHPGSIAPEDKQCGTLGWVDDIQYRCQVESGHDAAHAAEPGPGQTVAWPRESMGVTGFTGPYGLRRDTPEEIRQQRTEEILERQREDRRDAVELAVKALNGVTNADTIEEYGNDIIALAFQLGAYIRNGG